MLLLATNLSSGPFEAVALGMLVLVIYMLTMVALAHKEHKRRRRLLNLKAPPTPYSEYVDARRQARIRTEARMGLSDSPLQRQRGA